MDLFLRMLQNEFEFILSSKSVVWHFGARGSHRLEENNGQTSIRQKIAEQENQKRWIFTGSSSRTGTSGICSCVHHGLTMWSCNMYVCMCGNGVPRFQTHRSTCCCPSGRRVIQGSQIKRQVQKTGYLEALNIQIYLL